MGRNQLVLFCLGSVGGVWNPTGAMMQEDGQENQICTRQLTNQNEGNSTSLFPFSGTFGHVEGSQNGLQKLSSKPTKLTVTILAGRDKKFSRTIDKALLEEETIDEVPPVSLQEKSQQLNSVSPYNFGSPSSFSATFGEIRESQHELQDLLPTPQKVKLNIFCGEKRLSRIIYGSVPEKPISEESCLNIVGELIEENKKNFASDDGGSVRLGKRLRGGDADASEHSCPGTHHHKKCVYEQKLKEKNCINGVLFFTSKILVNSSIKAHKKNYFLCNEVERLRKEKKILETNNKILEKCVEFLIEENDKSVFEKQKIYIHYQKKMEEGDFLYKVLEDWEPKIKRDETFTGKGTQDSPNPCPDPSSTMGPSQGTGEKRRGGFRF
jgi:hypothetical protein